MHFEYGFFRLAGGVLLAFAWAVASAGCATSTNSLSKLELEQIFIESVDVRYAPNAEIWWGNAEREYAAKVTAEGKAPKKKGSSDLPGDNSGDDYREIMSTPEAQAYLRDKLAGLIKQRFSQDVSPHFRGTRAMRVEVEVHNFTIPSPLQRVALGGTPMLFAITVLKDAATGKEVAKLDKGAAGMAFGGVLGVALDQGLPDLEDRVLDAYSQNVSEWLKAR
jgi:hypothetical protein